MPNRSRLFNELLNSDHLDDVRFTELSVEAQVEEVSFGWLLVWDPVKILVDVVQVFGDFRIDVGPYLNMLPLRELWKMLSQREAAINVRFRVEEEFDSK